MPEKLMALRDAMAQNGLDAYIVLGRDAHQSEYVAEYWRTRQWLSGFTGSNGLVAVTKYDAGLWTDGRYFIQAEKELAGSGIRLFKMNEPEVPTYSKWLADNLPSSLNEAAVGFDGRCMSVLEFEAIKNALYDEKGKKISYFYDEDIAGALWENRPPLPAASIFAFDLSFAGKTSAEKLEDIRSQMKKKCADSYLATALDDVAWACNIRGGDIQCTPVAYAYLLITMDAAYLFIDERKVSACMRKHLSDFVIRPYEDIFDFAFKKSLLYVPSSTSVKLFDAIPKNIKTIAGPSIIEGLKAVKNEVEIENLHNAFLKEGVVMVKFLKWLAKQSDTKLPDETEIQNKISGLRKSQKHCLGDSFTTIAAYGKNAAIIHYAPTRENCSRPRPEGFLLIDTGGQYLDGTTDITRTIVMGPVTGEMKRDFTLVLKGHIALAGAKFLKGTVGTHLDMLARQHVLKAGMDYKHGTGHGIGFCLGVHEGPHNISTRYNNHKLLPGMLCSNEPGIYKEGRYGIRIENVMLVKELERNEYGTFLGFELVSFCPIDVRALDLSLLTGWEINWLNDYHNKVYKKLSPLLTEEERRYLKCFCTALPCGYHA